MDQEEIKEISVLELAKQLKNNVGTILLDVRQEHEYEEAHIAQAELIPLDELEEALDRLDKSATYAIHCRSGIRSEKAARVMKQHGFEHVVNVKGGILAWLEQVNVDTLEAL